LILGSILLLALGACSGKQTARTHAESSEQRLALGLADDFEAVDPVHERLSVIEHPAPSSRGLDTTSRENALLDAQRLLELLNPGRADEALAMIQQLGLMPESMAGPEAIQALMAQLQGARGRRPGIGGLQLPCGSGTGLALDGDLSAPEPSGRLGEGGIGSAFDSHRSAFDGIGTR
jgi:hypothetical protein